MDYHGQEFRPNAGDDFLELSSMPVDKQRQTQLWQQNQYLDDSGIQSGLTSHVPSVISGGTEYLSSSNEKVGWTQRRAYDSMSVVSIGDALVSPAPPSTGSINFAGLESFSDNANMDLRGNQLQDIDSSEVAAAIPDLIKVMRENDDHSVLYQASIMIFQLSKSEAIEALIGSDEMIIEVIQTLAKTEDPDMIRFFAGTLYNISQTQKGLKAIFNANCIPCLIKLLDSNIESVLFYAITTLHNLLLHQDGAKPLVRAEGKSCLRSMCVLLRKNNVKFLTILTDCLQILAYGHADSKLIILQHGGPQELVRILYQYSYEKLLWTTARVLKVLSVCSMNKPAIIQVGGLDALGRHLISSSNSQRLTMNCLWTLRNLSDAAASVTNVSIVPGSRNSLQNLLSALIHLLTSSDPAMVACSAGILSNLTCNNCTNKLLVCQCDGIKQLLAAVASNPTRNDILEPCVCALRHLTARHDGEETARAVLAGRDKFDGLPLLTRVLHAATAAVCPELGLLPTHNQQQSPLNWGVVKAMVGLIRNLALNRELHTCMREYGLVTGLIWLLYGTLISIFSARKRSGAAEVQNVRLEEIIEGICSALYILMRDAQCRNHLGTFQFPELRWTLFSEPGTMLLQQGLSPAGMNHALALFVYLLCSEQTESIQKAAAGVLCEASKDKTVLEALAFLIPCAQRRLNELVNVRNEAISTYCSTVLIRLAEEFNGGSLMNIRSDQAAAAATTGPLLDTPPHPGVGSNFDPTSSYLGCESFVPNSSALHHMEMQTYGSGNFDGSSTYQAYYNGWRGANTSPGISMDSTNDHSLGPYFN